MLTTTGTTTTGTTTAGITEQGITGGFILLMDHVIALFQEIIFPFILEVIPIIFMMDFTTDIMAGIITLYFHLSAFV